MQCKCLAIPTRTKRDLPESVSSVSFPTIVLLLASLWSHWLSCPFFFSFFDISGPLHSLSPLLDTPPSLDLCLDDSFTSLKRLLKRHLSREAPDPSSSCHSPSLIMLHFSSPEIRFYFMVCIPIPITISNIRFWGSICWMGKQRKVTVRAWCLIKTVSVASHRDMNHYSSTC